MSFDFLFEMPEEDFFLFDQEPAGFIDKCSELNPINGNLDDILPSTNDSADDSDSEQDSEVAKLTVKWTHEEDELLQSLGVRFKKNWTMIGRYFPDKNLQAVRARWLNKHDPKVKRYRWTKEEDDLIIALFIKHGGNWKAIANQFKERPADSIKNRFYGTVKKKLTQKQREALRNSKAVPSLSVANNSEAEKSKDRSAIDHEQIKELVNIHMKKLGTVEIANINLNPQKQSLTASQKQQRLQALYDKIGEIQSVIARTKERLSEISTPDN